MTGNQITENYLGTANTGGKIMVSQKIIEDARTMLEIVQHPERFCIICFKRVGVCEHTSKRG